MDPKMEETLREYARLLVRVGLNLEQGQTAGDLLPGGVRLLRPALRRRRPMTPAAGRW